MSNNLGREWGRFRGIAAFHAQCMSRNVPYTPKKPTKDTEYNKLVTDFNTLIDENQDKDVLLNESNRNLAFYKQEYSELLQKHNELVAKHNGLIDIIELESKSKGEAKTYNLEYVQTVKSDTLQKAVMSYALLNSQLKQTEIRESLSTKVFYTLNKVRANFIEKVIEKGLVSRKDFNLFLQQEIDKEDALDSSKSSVTFSEAKGWISINHPNLAKKIK